MGKRGPKPTPTETLLRRGSYNGKARAARGELRPGRCMPEAPEWLGPAARAHYARFAEDLHAHGLLTRLDAVTLGLMADALVQYIAARSLLEVDGEIAPARLVAHTDGGNEYQAPAVGAMNRAWGRVLQICREFGLTPSSRSGLVADAPPAGDVINAKERFFGVR